MEKRNNWDADAMKGTLISDMEQEVMEGMSKVATMEQPASVATVSDGSPSEKPAEPTKGVQTYIPMSMYRRLNDIKLTRGETIANLVAEAVGYWLDAQEK